MSNYSTSVCLSCSHCYIVRNFTKRATLNFIDLQPSEETFEKTIQEYIKGLEPIPDDQEDDSSDCETSDDSSSGSDSEVLYCGNIFCSSV